MLIGAERMVITYQMSSTELSTLLMFDFSCYSCNYAQVLSS